MVTSVIKFEDILGVYDILPTELRGYSLSDYRTKFVEIHQEIVVYTIERDPNKGCILCSKLFLNVFTPPVEQLILNRLVMLQIRFAPVIRVIERHFVLTYTNYWHIVHIYYYVWYSVPELAGIY